MLIGCLIGIILCHSENTDLRSHNVATIQYKKNQIYYDIKYFIQSLDLCSNESRLYPLTKKRLSDQFYDIERGFRKLNLPKPKTGVKVDKYAALREIVS